MNCNFNIIRNNTLSNNGKCNTTLFAIELDNSHNNTIIGNIISSNNAYGLRILESSDNNISIIGTIETTI